MSSPNSGALPRSYGECPACHWRGRSGTKPGQPSSLLFCVPSESRNQQLAEPVCSDHWEQTDKCDSELEIEKEAAGHQALRDALERASGPGAIGNSSLGLLR